MDTISFVNEQGDQLLVWVSDIQYYQESLLEPVFKPCSNDLTQIMQYEYSRDHVTVTLEVVNRPDMIFYYDIFPHHQQISTRAELIGDYLYISSSTETAWQEADFQAVVNKGSQDMAKLPGQRLRQTRRIFGQRFDRVLSYEGSGEYQFLVNHDYGIVGFTTPDGVFWKLDSF